LEDEVASEAIKEASRAFVEDVLEKGIASTKKRLRERDYTEAVKVRIRLLNLSLHLCHPLALPMRNRFCSSCLETP